jgi:phage gpG-like protein
MPIDVYITVDDTEMIGFIKKAEWITSGRWKSKVHAYLERMLGAYEWLMRDRFRDIVPHMTPKQRPNVYGSEILVRTGRLRASLTPSRGLYAIREIAGNTAIFGTTAPYAGGLSRGITSTTPRIRTPLIKRGLMWIDEDGRKHRARMTTDAGFVIPSRPFFFSETPLQEPERKRLENVSRAFWQRAIAGLE